MAVPGHDERDFEFARKFDLPIIRRRRLPRRSKPTNRLDDHGRAAQTRRSPVNGRGNRPRLSSTACRRPRSRRRSSTGSPSTAWASKAVNYKLRDWLFSRQHFWGEPFPILHRRRTTGVHAVARVASCRCRLPELTTSSRTGTPEPPLARPRDWLQYAREQLRRETNTMPQWAGSCWYYLRFLDPKNDRAALGPGEGKGLDAGRPLRRRGRARGAAPALRPVLAQGALRPRPRQHARAVPEAGQPGDDPGRDGVLDVPDTPTASAGHCQPGRSRSGRPDRSSGRHRRSP